MMKDGWSTLARLEQLQKNQLALFKCIAPRHFDLVIFVLPETERLPLATLVGFNAGNKDEFFFTATRLHNIFRANIFLSYHCCGTKEVQWEQIYIPDGITELQLPPEMWPRVRNIWLGSVERFTNYIARATTWQIRSQHMFILLANYSFMLPFLNDLIGIRYPSGTINMLKVENGGRTTDAKE
ncbi:hypothetical protein EJB05_30411, partial [Eragrostis curvula]